MAMKFNPKPVLVLAIVVSAFSALWVPTASAQARFTYSSDGIEVTDNATRLVWRRCVEGMLWSGVTCTGSARYMTHEQGLAHAQTQAGWRLPNAKELTSILDLSRVGPSISVEAFPATPSYWFWSSSPIASSSSQAWRVDFGSGMVQRETTRNNNYHVRLVRASQ